MKYKRLTSEELSALEKDFVQFLASAQITANDWEKMKATELEKAEELIDVFSDVVYDKVLRKIEYLEYRDTTTLNVFYCAPEKIHLLGLRVLEPSKIDLSRPDVLEQWEKDRQGVELVYAEKKYPLDREQELFELLQTGCLLSDGKLYRALKSLKK